MIRIVEVDSQDYQEEAVQLAEDELKRRGVVITPKPQNTTAEEAEEAEPIVELHSPRDEIELAFLKSVFDAEGIGYHVVADFFGSLRIGPQVPFFNKKTIMVRYGQLERAKELLMDYLDMTSRDGSSAKYSVEDKLRMIIETVLIGWFIPGRPEVEMNEEQPE